MLVALRNACCPAPAPTPWGPPRPTAARRVPAPDTAGRRRRRSDTAGAEHKETHPRPRRGPPRTGRRRRLVYAPAATTTTYTPARDSSIRRISAPARTTQRRSTRGSGARFSRRRGAIRSSRSFAGARWVGVRVRADPPPGTCGVGAEIARSRPGSSSSFSGGLASRGRDPRRYSLHVRPGPRLDMPPAGTATARGGAGSIARWLHAAVRGLALAAASLSAW